MPKKKIKVGATLLADYVAMGHANKITIVNAFSGDVLLADMPAAASFGVYMELFMGGVEPQNLTIEAVVDGQTVLRGRALAAEGSGDPATIAVPNLPFQFDKDCNLEFYVTADGYERTLAIRKAVRKGVIPRD